jgi:hypothetical protein
MRKNTFLAVLTVFAIASSSYAIDENLIEWFDLSPWTSIMNGESNFFEDVCGSDDLTVTAVGAFPTGNQLVGFGENEFVVSGLLLANRSHSFVFDYTGSERLVVEILTLDSEEFAEVHMPGAEDWQLVSGSTPNVSVAAPNGLRFQGVATGFGDPGVSNFLVFSETPVSTATVTFGSLALDKHEFVRIGKLVPEPGSMSLLGMSLLGLFGLIRRK